MTRGRQQRFELKAIGSQSVNEGNLVCRREGMKIPKRTSATMRNCHSPPDTSALLRFYVDHLDEHVIQLVNLIARHFTSGEQLNHPRKTDVTAQRASNLRRFSIGLIISMAVRRSSFVSIVRTKVCVYEVEAFLFFLLTQLIFSHIVFINFNNEQSFARQWRRRRR